MTAPLTAARAAYDAYTRACAEIAALDVLPSREGFMRARNAERRDWERRKRYAVSRMREACKEAWGIVYGLEIAA